MLVCPLNWGLGHASRCIPLIQHLKEDNFEPVIASDGDALNFLKKEFPELKYFELPSSKVTYSKRKVFFGLKILFQLPFLYLNSLKEHKRIEKIVKKEGISGIISDNRIGAFSNKTPSVYITHQLSVLAGSWTALASIIHQYFIQKFDECWIPDHFDFPSFSGRLGHITNGKINPKYIGILSRFKRKRTSKKYDIIIVLSGPEPQRSILEAKFERSFRTYKGKGLLVRGTQQQKTSLQFPGNIEVVDLLFSQELEQAINSSDLVIARSGYSSIMDLAILAKKVFFIPTPGQSEQEYLAKLLSQQQIAPYCTQDEFELDELKRIEEFNGFKTSKNTIDLNLFEFFKSK